MAIKSKKKKQEVVFYRAGHEIEGLDFKEKRESNVRKKSDYQTVITTSFLEVADNSQ